MNTAADARCLARILEFTEPTAKWASSVTTALEVLDATVAELLVKVNRLNEELAELRDGLLEVSQQALKAEAKNEPLREALRRIDQPGRPEPERGIARAALSGESPQRRGCHD